eukprot:GSA25T00001263001.1
MAESGDADPRAWFDPATISQLAPGAAPWMNPQTSQREGLQIEAKDDQEEQNLGAADADAEIFIDNTSSKRLSIGGADAGDNVLLPTVSVTDHDLAAGRVSIGVHDDDDDDDYEFYRGALETEVAQGGGFEFNPEQRMSEASLLGEQEAITPVAADLAEG